MTKTLLRYPGGKSRAVSVLKDYFPKDMKKLVSPFFGGGALELYFAQQGVEVQGYDSFEELVCFWKEVISRNKIFSICAQY